MYIATRTMLAWEMTRVEQSWMPGDLAPPNHKWRPAPPLQSQRLVEGSLNIFLGDIRKDGEDAFQAFLQQPRSDVMGDMRLFRSRAGFQVLVRQSPCTDFVLRVDGTISRASVQLTGTSLGGVQLCTAKFFDHVQSLRAACTRGAEKGADEAGAHVFDPASTAAGSIRAFAGRGGHLAACRGEDDQEVDQEAPPPQDERPEPILEERLRELSWLLM